MNRILPAVLTALLTLAPLSSAAQEAPRPTKEALGSLENRMILRCSTAFALGAQLQAAGAPIASEWPPLAEVGREYFVRTSARLMDVAGLSREDLVEALTAEAIALREGENLAAVMPACLSLLPPGAD